MSYRNRFINWWNNQTQTNKLFFLIEKRRTQVKIRKAQEVQHQQEELIGIKTELESVNKSISENEIKLKELEKANEKV